MTVNGTFIPNYIKKGTYIEYELLITPLHENVNTSVLNLTNTQKNNKEKNGQIHI